MRIPIVNEKDEIIKCIDIDDRTKGDICRATGLWVTDTDGNILLAQRAFRKRYSPGLWSPAVGGTVEEGETYESNIVKEAEEEIGLKGYKFSLGSKVRYADTHEFWGQWYTAVVPHDYPFIKQEEEVEAIKWFTEDELLELLKEKPEMFIIHFGPDKSLFFKTLK